MNDLERYADIVNNPPKDGSILTTFDGKPALLSVQTTQGNAPFIYTHAYVYEILGDQLGWYVRSVEEDREIGYRCVLMTKSRKDVIGKCKDQLKNGQLLVKSLRVIRKSESGKSLLCEVSSYCTPEELAPYLNSSNEDDGLEDAAQEIVDSILSK